MLRIVDNIGVFLITGLAFAFCALISPIFFWLAAPLLSLAALGVGWIFYQLIFHPTRASRPAPIQRATGKR